MKVRGSTSTPPPLPNPQIPLEASNLHIKVTGCLCVCTSQPMRVSFTMVSPIDPRMVYSYFMRVFLTITNNIRGEIAPSRKKYFPKTKTLYGEILGRLLLLPEVPF